MTKKVDLTDVQKKALEFIKSHNYSICAIGMGLGKTLVALHFAITSGQPCLVICPSSLILNWVDEINKWDWGKRIILSVIHKKKDIYRLWDTDIAIISYDNAVAAEVLYEWAHTVVIDEGQSINSMKAKRTEAIHKHVYENSIKKLIILTGTPIKNRVEEFYSLISLCYYNPKFVDPEFFKKFPDSVTFADNFSIRKQYQIEVKTKKGKKFKMPVITWSGVKNLDELKKVLAPIYFRAKGTPGSYIIKDVIIGDEDDPALLEEFERFELNPEKVKPAEKILAAEMMAPSTADYAKLINKETDSPVVIFSDHRNPAKKIAEALGVPALTGEISGKERMKYVLEFQKGQHNFLVTTCRALGEGANMTASYNLILNDLPWSAGLLMQVIKRIDRLGQTKRAVIHLMHHSPQTRMIYDKLKEKMKTMEQAT